MTVIKYPMSLINYPLQWVSEDAVALVEARMIQGNASNSQALRLMECVAHVAEIPLGATCLTDGSMAKVVGLLVEALQDRSLVDLGPLVRSRYIAKFQSILVPEASNNMSYKVEDHPDDDSVRVTQSWQQMAGGCSKHTMRYWNGWPMFSRKRDVKYLSIQPIWISHGSEFAEAVYGALHSYYLKQARPAIAVHNKIFNHIHQHRDRWPVEAFQDPMLVDELFKEVMSETFLDLYDRALNTDTYGRLWNTSMLSFENSLIAREIWAAPHEGLPRAPTNGGNEQHWHRMGKDGRAFIGKTITRIPIEVNDQQAMKILFTDVQSDLKTVLDWAQDQANELRRRSVMRRYVGTRSDIDKLLLTHAPDYVANCRKFEADGFNSNKNYINSRYGADYKTQLSHDWGMPISHSLFPFQLLIVNQQPAITPTFLYDVVLFKPNGDPYGFRCIDGVYYLTSRKDRMGPDKSEQSLPLTPVAAKLVMQVIRITQPLRERLKKDGKDAWRYLFLTCGNALHTPRKAKPTHLNKGKLSTSNGQKTLANFSRFTTKRDEDLVDFVSSVSLASVRATVGLNVYIQTGSVTKMAKALGHTSRSVTLGHYLPKAILDFFEVRWVRVFQRNMICLAMENSPYLFKASSYTSMEELDTFLTNHALNEVPYHMQDPERKQSANKLPDTVYIHVSVGILTILLSIEKAVDLAKHSPDGSTKTINGYAAYWSRFARALVSDITRGKDRVLHGYLETAQKHASVELAQEFIYEAA
ncbi:hypothetical protein [Pseudomonas sp. X4]|uniref:hypothetical protein n=1 Tax=Pseudomonas sp. X4 TaxID=3231526 RepID=UPI00345F8572